MAASYASLPVADLAAARMRRHRVRCPWKHEARPSRPLSRPSALKDTVSSRLHPCGETRAVLEPGRNPVTDAARIGETRRGRARLWWSRRRHLRDTSWRSLWECTFPKGPVPVSTRTREARQVYKGSPSEHPHPPVAAPAAAGRGDRRWQHGTAVPLTSDFRTVTTRQELTVLASWSPQCVVGTGSSDSYSRSSHSHGSAALLPGFRPNRNRCL